MIRSLDRDPTMLPPAYEFLYRYAVNLAKIGWLRTPDGKDVELSGALGPYRSWLRDQLLRLFPRGMMPDAGGLHALAPLVAVRTDIMRYALKERYSNDFSLEDLDREVSVKKLALVLGGGGGSGLAHLGAFSLLNDLHLKPSYIVGASMGSLMGLIRALRHEYDPVMTALVLPKKFDLRNIFRPFSGYSRFGFPGAFDMNLVPVARDAFHALFNEDIPRFCDLPIRLEVVSTGVRTGLQEDSTRLEAELLASKPSRFTPFGMRSKLKVFFRTVKQLASNPRFLKQIVFNDEPGTEEMRVIEPVGFSCSVPGLLHFDIFDDNPTLTEPFQRLFQRHGLYRLTDGGVINNVPSRVAWRSIQKGKLGSRNAFIYAIDSFAPVPTRNAIFMPIQQLARPGVLANRPYSDFTRTLRSVPSPINLAPSHAHLKRIVKAAHKELSADATFIRRACTPLPHFAQWWPHLHIPGVQREHAQVA